MKRQRQSDSANVITLRLWTYAGALKLVPYLHALMQSLRESWLELRQAKLQLQRAERHPGRPNRDSIVRLEEARRTVSRADAAMEETLQEMLALSAYSIDPGAGAAVIPFLRGEDLAWFIFDLFDTRGLVAWRLHSDPLELRRPLSELEHREAVPGLADSRTGAPDSGDAPRAIPGISA